jgi:hypothetical protein
VKLVNLRSIGEATCCDYLVASTTGNVRLLDIFRKEEILKHSLLPRLASLEGRSPVVPRSVLDAIKMGIWDFEPREVEYSRFDASDAMPGTDEKLCALAERARKGLPLWHVHDRDDVEAPPPAVLRRKPR